MALKKSVLKQKKLVFCLCVKYFLYYYTKKQGKAPKNVRKILQIMKQVTEKQTINTKSEAMNAVIMYAFNFDYNFICNAFGENYIALHLKNKFNDILHTTANKNLGMAFITFHSQLSDNNKEILNNYILNQNK